MCTGKIMAKSHTKTSLKSQPKALANGAHQAVGKTAELPCYALSLTVENVRCFGPKQALNLADKEGRPVQWTIILGENGTGKTTLLQALACIEMIKSSKFREDDKPITVPSERPRLIDLWLRPQVQSTADAIGLVRVSNQQNFAFCVFAFTNRANLQESNLTGETHEIFWKLDNQQVNYEEETPPALIFYAYGAGRRLSGVSLRQEPIDDPVGTLFNENALLRNAEEWLLQLDYAASKESEVQAKQKSRLEQVKQLLIAILPDVEDIRFATTGGIYPKARVEFQTFSGWVPLRRLGYGYQTLIAWVTDFASRMGERYPESPDPLKEAAIVLVDEIDLHLHPVWQRKLIAFLTERFPNTQFIATAHSPLIVQAAENANIALLRRVGDHVEIVNEPEQIRGWRIDQILTSDLFGLTSARSSEVEGLFQRKEALLNKAKQSARDKVELREIQEKIDELPVGDSAQSAKEMEVIREALNSWFAYVWGCFLDVPGDFFIQVRRKAPQIQ